MATTDLSSALRVLREGGIILYPTDTIWGLGCDATNPEAVARIYKIKNRSDSKSLVLLASDMDMVCRYVKEVPGIAVQLVEVNDKPMTIVYPGAIAGEAPAEGKPARADRYCLAWNTVASDGSVGIRVPMAGFCRDLIAGFGRPVVSTSANISGESSPKTFADIPQSIKDSVDYIVEPALEQGSTGQASSILKVGLGGEIQIIRK